MQQLTLGFIARLKKELRQFKVKKGSKTLLALKEIMEKAGIERIEFNGPDEITVIFCREKEAV
jgi:hypothetical protein